MTAYVAMDRLPLSRIVRAAPYSAIPGESLIGLRAGQRVSVRDLLYGLILESGNDAAYTLAVASSGSEPRFVRQMNLRAAALGLSDTHFANPIGLDEPGNHSSAQDLIALTRRLFQRRAFRRIAASEEAVLRSMRPPVEIDTRNTLLYRLPEATGVKTGHTLGAGYVLVGSARRGGVELISAVLGASSETGRDLETIELLDHGFSLYRQRRPVRRDQELEVAVRAPDEVEGPVRRGRRLGTATVTLDGRTVAVVPLLTARSIGEAELFDKARGYAEENLALLGFGLCGILLAVIAVAGLRRRGRSGEHLADQSRIERDQRRSERDRRRREREEARR